MCTRNNILDNSNVSYVCNRKQINCPCIRNCICSIILQNGIGISGPICQNVDRHVCRIGGYGGLIRRNNRVILGGNTYNRSECINCNGCLHKLILQGGYKYGTQCNNNNNSNGKVLVQQPDNVRTVQHCCHCAKQRNQIILNRSELNSYCLCQGCCSCLSL